MTPASPGLVRRLGPAMGLSLLVHIAALPALKALILRPIDPAENAAVPATTVLGEAELDELVAALENPPEPAPRVPLPPPPKPPSPRPDGQVVEIPPPEREETPDDARFLSEYDSKVDKEQVSARNAPPTPAMRKSDRRLISTGDDVEGAVDGRREARPEQKPETTAAVEKEGDAQRDADQAKAEARAQPDRRRQTDQATPLTEGAGPFRRADEAGDRQATAPPSGGRAGGAATPPSYESLLPTLGPEEMAAMQGSIDHVEDVEKGEATFLNTREYKFAWFFNRVKRSVQQQWNAVDVHRRYDPYGRVYGVRDRLTVVEVTLTPDGQLDDIYVKKDSGVAFLDEAALKAFRDAAPFPNPPEALRDDDGRIRFSFGFYLEINGRGFRMFRYR